MSGEEPGAMLAAEGDYVERMEAVMQAMSDCLPGCAWKDWPDGHATLAVIGGVNVDLTEMAHHILAFLDGAAGGVTE